MFLAPVYNRTVKYDINEFQSHYLQSLMAVFVAKKQSELVSQLKHVPKFYREDLFFDEFNRFIGKYVNMETLATDLKIYFRSSAEQKPGTQIGAGGTGNRSGSYASSFRAANRASQDYNRASTAYFEEKYRASIRGEKDERRFLDEIHIWDKIAEDKYTMPTKWLKIVNMSYDDATFVAKLPESIDKQLVPLAIRNKVLQTHKNASRSSPTTVAIVPPLVPPEHTMAANPLLEAEIEKMLEEEGW